MEIKNLSLEKKTQTCWLHLAFVSSIQHFPEAEENYTQAGIFQKCANDLLSQICRANEEILALKYTYLPPFPYFIAEEIGPPVVCAQRATELIAICLV